MSIEYLRNQKKYLSQPYVIGRGFEYQVMKHLRKQGWYVIRKFGSWGEEDLVAIKSVDRLLILAKVWFIQCKYSRKKATSMFDMPKFQRRKLVEKAKRYGAEPIFAGVKEPGKRPRMYFERIYADYEK